MNGWGNTTDEARSAVSVAVDAIFTDLEKFHGSRYVVEKLGNFDEESAMRAKMDWANEIIRIPKNLVVDGLRKARKSQWCPTLAQFVSMCLPTAEQAFYEAVQGKVERSHGREFAYSCPAVYWAAKSFDGDVCSCDWKQSKSRWEKVWDEEVARQGKGLLADVPPAPKQVTYTPPEPSKPNPDVVAKIRAHGGLKMQSNPIAWAIKLRSVMAAKKLIEGFNGVHKIVLQPAIDYHLGTTKKIIRNAEGVLLVGDYSLFVRV